MKSNKTYFLLVLATFFWGANFIFAKTALKTLEPGIIATGRFLLASILLMLIYFFKKNSFKWKEVKSKLMVLTISGIIGVFAYNLLMFTGLKSTSSTNGALIMGLNPMFTLLLSGLILKTTINRFQIVGVLLSFCGVIFIISKGQLENILELNFVQGDILMLVSSMVFGLYNVINKKYLSGIDALNLTAFTTFPATLLFIAYTFTNTSLSEVHITNEALISMVFMGLLGSVLAYYFWNFGVKQIGADASAIFINLVPLFATLMSLFIGQTINVTQIIGGVMIIGGVYVSTKFKTKW